MKDPVKDKLKRFELSPKSLEGRFSPTIETAVSAHLGAKDAVRNTGA